MPSTSSLVLHLNDNAKFFSAHTITTQMITALLQFSGSPNTEQFRLVEFFAICSSVAASNTSHNGNNSKGHNCTCCCSNCASACSNNPRASSCSSATTLRVLGGCPAICNSHPRRSLDRIFHQQQSTCTECHLPRNSPTPSLTLEQFQLVCARTFAAFHQNECGCLFVEVPSLDFLRAVVERSMMISCAWLVGGADQDSLMPDPAEKVLGRNNYFAAAAANSGNNSNNDDEAPSSTDTKSQRLAVVNDEAAVTGTYRALCNSHRIAKQICEATSDDNNNNIINQTLSHFAQSYYRAPSFTYKIEYATGSKYGNEYAREYVNTQLAPHPVAHQHQRYNFRTPDVTLLMFIVPPADLLDLEQKQQQQQQQQQASATRNNLVDPQQTTTFYLHCTQFATSPRGFLMSLYTVKHRRYIGTTTMVPELTFLMCNSARVKRNDLTLDPFCGTGSIPMAMRHLGARPLGFDIDGRVMRKGTKDSAQSLQAAQHRQEELRKRLPQLLDSEEGRKFANSPAFALAKRNVEQLESNSASMRQNFIDFGLGFGPDCFVGSFSAFSKCFGGGAAARARSAAAVGEVGEGWLDAIVTDPPYGIRETKRMTEQPRQLLQQQQTKNGGDNDDDDDEGFSKPTAAATTTASTNLSWNQPLDNHPLYEATELLVDLVSFAATNLVRGGRLVFWMSVTSYEYSDKQLPSHPLIRVVSNIPQQLNAKTVRRFVVMERVSLEEEQLVLLQMQQEQQKLPTREEMVRNTVRGLELRKAFDLPVPEQILSAAAAAAAAAAAVLAQDDSSSAAATGVAAVDPDVLRAIETAKRKKEQRQRKNEASAAWRAEHGMVVQQQQQQAAVTATVSSDSAAAAAPTLGKKATTREKNVANRAKNLQRMLQEGDEKNNNKQHKGSVNNNHEDVEAARQRRDEGSRQPSSSSPPAPQ